MRFALISCLCPMLFACGQVAPSPDDPALTSSIALSSSEVTLRFLDRERKGCERLLAEPSVSVNGVEIGKAPASITADALGCAARWPMGQQPEGKVTVNVYVHGAAFAVDVEGLFGPRVLSMATAASHTLRVGQRAVFGWEPANDVFVIGEARLHEPLTANAKPFGPVAGQSGQLMLDVPSSYVGSAAISVKATVRPRVARCTAPRGCEVEPIDVVTNPVAVTIWP